MELGETRSENRRGARERRRRSRRRARRLGYRRCAHARSGPRARGHLRFHQAVPTQRISAGHPQLHAVRPRILVDRNPKPTLPGLRSSLRRPVQPNDAQRLEDLEHKWLDLPVCAQRPRGTMQSTAAATRARLCSTAQASSSRPRSYGFARPVRGRNTIFRIVGRRARNASTFGRILQVEVKPATRPCAIVESTQPNVAALATKPARSAASAPQ